VSCGNCDIQNGSVRVPQFAEGVRAAMHATPATGLSHESRSTNENCDCTLLPNAHCPRHNWAASGACETTIQHVVEVVMIAVVIYAAVRFF